MGIALLVMIIITGTGAGIFNFLVILMAMGSLVVLIPPFQYLAAKHVVILYMMCLIFEFIIF